MCGTGERVTRINSQIVRTYPCWIYALWCRKRKKLEKVPGQTDILYNWGSHGTLRDKDIYYSVLIIFKSTCDDITP
jgi:hypothetical protein